MSTTKQLDLFPNEVQPEGMHLCGVGCSTGALFSDCRKYRYVLWRIWDDSLPKVMFIGLNPSTANEDSDDPTIRRVKTFAKSWGFGGVYMLNLFTYVTAYPEELKKCKNPLMLADWYLKVYAAKSDKIIFAWGNFKEAKERAQEILQMFPGEMLIQNKDGSPRHPLYVPGNVVPVRRPILKTGSFPMDQKLLALSWKQPFATAMLYGKIETRTWNTNVRGWVLICTSLKAYGEDIEHKLCGTELYYKMLRAMNRDSGTLDLNGYGIAIGRLVDCRRMKPEDADKCFVKWREDLYCHVYEDVRQIRPIIWKGTQGWKEVTDDIKRTIEIL